MADPDQARFEVAQVRCRALGFDLHKIDAWFEIRVVGGRAARGSAGAPPIAQLASLAAVELWLDKAERNSTRSKTY